MRYSRRSQRRVAASETVGAIMAIAITLVAGGAAWGYVRGEAGTSEGALQANAAATNNFLSEHFNVVDMYFSTTTASGGSCAGGNQCSASFWLYNTGSITFQTLSVRLYGSGGNINVLFNFTQSGGTYTNYVYDLRSSLSTKCKTAASPSYEAPSLSTTLKTTNAQLFTLTVPPTTSGCPSFGGTFQSGHTYSIVVTGLYGNVVTFSQSD